MTDDSLCDAAQLAPGRFAEAKSKWEKAEAALTAAEALGTAGNIPDGVAAAALAVSLYTRGTRLPEYKCYQGTVMGRPSLIRVIDLNLQGNQNKDSRDSLNSSSSSSIRAHFGLQGRVEIDNQETVYVRED